MFCNKSYQWNNFEISRANIGGGTHLFQEANASNGNSQKHRSILWDSYILFVWSPACLSSRNWYRNICFLRRNDIETFTKYIMWIKIFSTYCSLFEIQDLTWKFQLGQCFPNGMTLTDQLQSVSNSCPWLRVKWVFLLEEKVVCLTYWHGVLATEPDLISTQTWTITNM